MLAITSFNINSIRARTGLLTRWLAQHQPDIMGLQELKATADQVPLTQIQAAGYDAYIVGQKTYNGVALLARKDANLSVEVIAENLPNSPDQPEPQARFLHARVTGKAAGSQPLDVITIYVPNGNPIDPDAADGGVKYALKRGWYRALVDYIPMHDLARKPFVLMGDFNIIPEVRDCADPKAWQGDALFVPEMRRVFRQLLGMGLYDAQRVIAPDGGHEYTFWDYQRGAWQRDDGIRIDHFLLSAPMVDRLEDVAVDREQRSWEKPSDHTPITARFECI